MHSEIQPSSVDSLKEYDSAILVAGSRGFNNYRLFSECLEDYLLARHDEKTYIFITGKAPKGADALIIQWCKEHGQPWVEFPADWAHQGNSAGYIRNVEMAQHATHALIFWDAASRGTKHMITIAKKKGVAVRTLLVDNDD